MTASGVVGPAGQMRPTPRPPAEVRDTDEDFGSAELAAGRIMDPPALRTTRLGDGPMAPVHR